VRSYPAETLEMAKTMTATIRQMTPEEVLRERASLHAIYLEAFAAPPYRRDESAATAWSEGTLATHVRRAGFRFVAARVRADGPPLGFAYGYTGQAGQWWHDIVARALGPAMAVRWMRNNFEFVELAVAPSIQGRGIGARLHDALLADLPHPSAVLSTAQAETPALRLYRSRGWAPLLHELVFPGNSLPYTILGLDLRREGVCKDG
jgi:ribosomal protein S18 acetylase RimI-like enzyme